MAEEEASFLDVKVSCDAMMAWVHRNKSGSDLFEDSSVEAKEKTVDILLDERRNHEESNQVSRMPS